MMSGQQEFNKLVQICKFQGTERDVSKEKKKGTTKQMTMKLNYESNIGLTKN